MERIVIETDEQTKQSLKVLAAKENRTMKEILAQAIKEFLKKNK